MNTTVRITTFPRVSSLSQDEKFKIKKWRQGHARPARLVEQEQEKQHAPLPPSAAGRSDGYRSGSADNRVSDHRIGSTLHQLDLVMEAHAPKIVDAAYGINESERLNEELGGDA